MQTRSRSPFTTIHTEGVLLPADLLQRVLENDKGLPGLSPEGYHLSGEKLNEAINRSWNRLQGSWAAFRTSRSRLGPGDAGTTLTRERWLLPLFQELGYGRLLTAKAIEIEAKSYAISHGWANVPIHLVGCGVDLERRSAGVVGASKASPHSLMQEFLNRSPEAQWGLVSNGLRLRVLRDNASLTRQAFLEFDLEAMFEGEVYSDFALLWLMCHQSRFENQGMGNRELGVGTTAHSPLPTADCILEQWSKTAQEQGTRALEQLRKGVEQAIVELGAGFLRSPTNENLRAALRSGELDTQQYYRQLLRLVYRLIFLFVAEDRDLLFDPASSPDARGRYLRHYSLARLRHLAERSRGGRHPDLYAALKIVTDILGGRQALTPGSSPTGERGANLAVTGLGLPVLGGFLFSREAMPHLETSELENVSLLSAIRSLAFMEEGRTRRVVDYKNLGVRELGGVYESLLELHPLINASAGTFELTAVSGSERKTTGSFFSPEGLISLLLDSALEPVIAQALARAGSSIEKQIAALLNLKICDPACGSGHFLLAAARRLARRLAQLRTGEGEPPPEALRAALREVISQCIYGVDINPMSVELCKVSLWMEALEPGKPLSFLDAHIQCGDSLVGVAPGLEIAEIPDEAFNPAFGDDKATASALKKRNKAERGGQMGLDVFVIRDQEDLAAWMARQAQEMDALPEETAEQVGQKAQTYREYLDSPQYRRRKQEYDLWTAAFFWKMEAQPGSAGILAPTQEMLRRQRSGGALPPELVRRVDELARRLNFLHWELAFPKVFAGENPGFDCMLGNPPWERIKLQEEEFFAQRDPEIAGLSGVVRKKAIKQLIETNPSLAVAFEEAKHEAECSSKFARKSDRFPLTAIGDINTYPLFSDLATCLISKSGSTGIIVPTGIATADTTKLFFDSLVSKGRIISIYDFLEARDFFIGLESRDPFCLFTVGGESVQNKTADFVFKMLSLEDIRKRARHIQLSPSDFWLFNPNTRNCPMFYTETDKELAQKIYRNTPILWNEQTENNYWGAMFATLFHMSNDSGLFNTNYENGFLRLYEAKYLHQYDHRWATYDSDVSAVDLGRKQDSNFLIETKYWVNEKDVQARIKEHWKCKWFIAFRNNARENDERTAIFSVIPLVGVGNSAPLLLLDNQHISIASCLVGNLSSLVFDFVTRQKIGGANFNFFIVKQLPVLPPNAYTPADIAYIAPRVLELVYTAYDLRPFAEDMGYHGEPFRWDEVRRAQLRAELDAYYARLYGLTRDELRYILDPKEVHGEDFPGETFRVLKEKEIRQFGEYRTRRLVLDAWDGLEGVRVSSYQVSRENPPMEGSPRSTPDITAAAKGEGRSRQKSGAEGMQASFSDFDVYTCSVCGVKVMGFEREGHVKDVHRGQDVEWRKIE